jgi:hypothetical protein
MYIDCQMTGAGLAERIKNENRVRQMRQRNAGYESDISCQWQNRRHGSRGKGFRVSGCANESAGNAQGKQEGNEMKRALMTASGMACGCAMTLIVHGGDVSEIAGAACVSLALVIAATILPDIRRRGLACRDRWHGEE